MRIRVSSKASNLFMIFAADAEAAENETETHIVQLDECFPSCCVPYLCCNRYRKWLMFRYRVRCFVKHRYFERIILFLILASSFVLVSIVDYCKSYATRTGTSTRTMQNNTEHNDLTWECNQQTKFLPLFLAN